MKAPMYILEEEASSLNINDGEQRQPVDFSEYVWMAEELEEFDRQVEEELWEEFFIESCFEEMLDDEDESYNIQSDGKTIAQEKLECLQAIQALQGKSTLNPNAPEFIPSSYYYVDENYEEEDYAQR